MCNQEYVDFKIFKNLSKFSIFNFGCMFLWVIISSRVYKANNFFKNLFFNSAIVLCANFDPLKVPALLNLGFSNNKANLILDSSNIIFLPCMRDQRSYSSISLGKEMLQGDQINSSVWTVKDTCPLSFGCWITYFISNWEGNNCLKRWANSQNDNYFHSKRIIWNKNGCYFVNLLSLSNNYFFLSLR